MSILPNALGRRIDALLLALLYQTWWRSVSLGTATITASMLLTHRILRINLYAKLRHFHLVRCDCLDLEEGSSCVLPPHMLGF